MSVGLASQIDLKSTFTIMTISFRRRQKFVSSIRRRFILSTVLFLCGICIIPTLPHLLHVFWLVQCPAIMLNWIQVHHTIKEPPKNSSKKNWSKKAQRKWSKQKNVIIASRIDWEMVSFTRLNKRLHRNIQTKIRAICCKCYSSITQLQWFGIELNRIHGDTAVTKQQCR